MTDERKKPDEVSEKDSDSAAGGALDVSGIETGGWVVLTRIGPNEG